jgi:hypothetical protein
MTAVRETLEELGIEDVPLIAVSKGPDRNAGREHFHFPDGREKLLPLNSPVLFYLQQLRDEAHRFAIGAHRAKRSRAITASPLDEIPASAPRASARCCCISAPPAKCGRLRSTISSVPLGLARRWPRPSMISITPVVKVLS